MKVAQAIAQSLGHCRKKDISSFTIEEGAEVVRALNQAIATYYQLAPDLYKRTTVSEWLGEPESLTGLSVAVGSTTNTGTPFDPADRGKTVLLAGDSNYNEIISTTSLLRPHRGATTATTGTLYHDTISFFDSGVERVVTDARAISNGQQYRLTRATEALHGVIYPWAGLSGFALAMGAWSPRQRTTGSRPRIYSCLLVGDSIATGTGDARFMIRFDPIPTAGCIIEMEIDMLPTAYTVDALDDGTEIPIADQRCAAMLLPMLEYHLMATSLWANPQIAALISNRYDEAKALTANLPTQLARPLVRWGNRNGW